MPIGRGSKKHHSSKPTPSRIGLTALTRSELIAQPAVEAFDKAVLLRFGRRDVVPPDADRVRPAEDGIRGQLGAVIADDRVGAPPLAVK